MSTYVIAIGGTGAKLVEAIIHLASAGIYALDSQIENLEILIVDPDTGNGNIVAAYSTTLTHYQKSRELLKGGIDENLSWWMQSEVNKFGTGLLSPFNNNSKTLKEQLQIGNYNQYSPVRQLFNVLYSQAEQELNLEEGFRGRPVIGSAIMAQMVQKDQKPKIWRELVEKITREANSEAFPQVFLCGSIFGGTGAAGFPTLGRLLANDLAPVLHRVKLGGLLMLPYFKFKPPSDGEIYARPEEFLLKTEYALRYYKERVAELRFDRLYTLGLPNYTLVKSESTGGNDQRNPPHFLEVFGGLALRDFILQPKSSQTVFVDISRQSPHLVSWEDLPNSSDRTEVRDKIINTARFAFAWLSTIVPEVEHAKHKPREITWARKFLNKHQLQSMRDKNHPENAKLIIISDWCQDYLRWLYNLHEIENSHLRWFNTNAFAVDGYGKVILAREDFPHLVSENGGIPINKVLRKLNKHQLNPPDHSEVAAIALALYRSIYQS